MRVALRFLVMVMLLTVLSPKFGWESVSAAQAHIHTAGMAHDEMAGHETHDGCHQHDAAVNMHLDEVAKQAIGLLFEQLSPAANKSRVEIAPLPELVLRKSSLRR